MIQTQVLAFAFSFACFVLFRDLTILCVLVVGGGAGAGGGGGPARVTCAAKALVWSEVRGQFSAFRQVVGKRLVTNAFTP